MKLIICSLIALFLTGSTGITSKEKQHVTKTFSNLPSVSYYPPHTRKESLKRRYVRGSPKKEEGEDFSREMNMIFEWVLEENIVLDYKELCDRPIKKNVGDGSPKENLQKCLNELEELPQVNRTKDNFLKIVDKYFETAKSELADWSLVRETNPLKPDSPLNKIMVDLESIYKRLGISNLNGEKKFRKFAPVMVQEAILSNFALTRMLRPLDGPYKEISYHELNEKGILSAIEGAFNIMQSSRSIKSYPEYDTVVDCDRSLRKDLSTLLGMPKPVLLPGGRFRETYYWDTYWIIRGLCISGYPSLALDLLTNFFAAVDEFGFVPNGFRTYYLDRSQPPMLSESVKVVFESLVQKNELETAYRLLRQAIPRLLKEYIGFWMNPGTNHIYALDGNNIISGNVFPELLLEKVEYLNRYYSPCETPRPEMYISDRLLEKQLDLSEVESKRLFRSIRAAAESGWDFSSRWSRKYITGSASSKDEYFEHIDTINVLPVDLNAILYKVEQNMAEFLTLLLRSGDIAECRDTTKMRALIRNFETLAEVRKKTMQKYMVDIQTGEWRDYYAGENVLSKVISAASIFPIWAGIPNGLAIEADIPAELLPSEDPDEKRWGLFTTNQDTGQQWDYPNVWPPLIQISVEALERRSEKFSTLVGLDSYNQLKERRKLVRKLCMDFWHAVLATAESSRDYPIFEKYSCVKFGSEGIGGEYEAQKGFGWTNGVILEFNLREFEHRLALYQGLEENKMMDVSIGYQNSDG